MTLQPNTTYYYRVKAINSTQESEYSEVMSVTTLPDADALATVLPASNPDIFKILTFQNKVEVYVQLPFLNEGIEEYKVTVSPNSDYSAPLYNNLTYVLNKNTNYAIVNQVRYVVFTVSNLIANTLYYLRIKAVNKIGQSGNTDTSFSTESILEAPEALGTTNLTAITARINWCKVADATSYLVEVDDNANFSSPVVTSTDVGDVNFYDVPVLIENTVYYYRVRAKQGSILSKYSNIVSFTTLDDIETYDDLSYNLTNPVIIGIRNNYLDTFQINWYPTERAKDYTLDISTVIDFSTFVAQDLTTTETKYVFTGLNPATVYYLRIKANNEAKSSGYTIQTVTTLVNNTNLSTPQALTPSTVLSTAFVLSWVKRNYATRYRIQLSTASNFSTILQTIFVGDIDSYIIDRLTPNTTYYVRIYALSSTEASNASNVVTVATAATLPSISLSDPSELTDTTVRLAWTLNSAYNNYKLSIYKKIDLVSITEGRTNFLGDGFFNNFDVGNSSNYLVDLFLEPSTTYSYYVTGDTPNGDSKSSATEEFSTKAKAPTIQISNNGKYLEWTDTLTRLEVSTDRDFKTLVQGWHPRTVENVSSIDISALTESDTSYYLRGYDVVDDIPGTFSNVISTFGMNPLLLPAKVTKTTALIRWKKNKATNYSVQVFVDSGGSSFVPITGHSFPVNVGDSDFYYLKTLSADTVYALYLNWFDEVLNKYVPVSLPLYFKTNLYDNVTEATTSGSAPTAVTTIDYDRFTITPNTSGTYLLELSKRSDFLTLDKYIEFVDTTEVIAEPSTTYYARVYKVIGADKSNVLSLTITTDALPSFSTALTTGVTISSVTILNETEALLNWNVLPNATGYVVEISETNTFNRLDKTVYVTFLDISKALVSGFLGTKTYYARVYGYNAHSISAYSNIVTIDTTP